MRSVITFGTRPSLRPQIPKQRHRVAVSIYENDVAATTGHKDCERKKKTEIKRQYAIDSVLGEMDNRFRERSS